MSKAELGAGDVALELDGETVTLRPSLEACIALTTDPRGLFGEGSIYDRIQKLDIAVMARILRLGLGIGASAVKDLEGQMYKTGLATLREPLSEFCGIVVTGGRRMDDADQAKGEGGDPPKAGA